MAGSVGSLVSDREQLHLSCPGFRDSTVFGSTSLAVMSASRLTAGGDACSAHSAGVLPGGSGEGQVINQAKLVVQQFEQQVEQN